MLTQLNWVNIIEVIILFLFMIIAGIWGAGDETEEEYLVGGRDISDWKIAGTLSAGIIGGGVILVLSEYTFKYGLSASFIVAGIVTGTLLMLPVARKFKPIADQHRFYTLPDFYLHEWGRKAGKFSTIIVGIWTISFIIMQLISAGIVLEVMMDWPYWVGVVVSAITVASYLIYSGFRAVVITDVIQYFALIVLLLLVLPAAVAGIRVEGFSRTALSVHMDWGEAAGFFMLGCLNMLVSADMWQRLYAARDTGHAKRGLIYSAIAVTIAGALLLLPPLYARVALPETLPNHALINSLSHLLPRWLLGFGLVGVLSTIIATLDTMVFILGISIGHDWRVQQAGKPIDDRILFTRLSIIIALVVGCLVSIVNRNLLSTGLALSTLGFVLAPSLLWRLTKHKPASLAVETGMVVGLATTLILLITNIFIPGILTPQNTILALITSLVGTVLGQVWYYFSKR